MRIRGKKLVDNKTFIIELISNGAWPVVVASSIYVLKDKLSTLFSGGVKSAKHGDTEIQFFEGKQDVKKESIEQQDLEHLIPVDPTGLRADVESKIKNQLLTVDSDKKVDVLIKNLAQQQLTATFEKIYYNVYGSQIRLLEFLSVQPSGKSESSEVLKFYEDAKDANKLVYGGVEFSDYMNFLVTWDLVKRQDEGWVITKAGGAFLTYITAAQYNKNKTL